MPRRPISVSLSGTCSSSSEEQVEVHSPNVTDTLRLRSETFGITRVGELDDPANRRGHASTSDARIPTYVCPPWSSRRSRKGSSHEVLGDGYVTETSKRSLDPSRLYCTSFFRPLRGPCGPWLRIATHVTVSYSPSDSPYSASESVYFSAPSQNPCISRLRRSC